MFGTLHTQVGLKGNEAEITYTITGRYRPSTLLDPPEFPDIEVDEVRIYGKGLEQGKPLKVDQEKIIEKYWPVIDDAISEQLRGKE